MQKWITTNWYSVDYGWDYGKQKAFLGGEKDNYSHLTTPQESLRDKLNWLITELNINQYTVKAVIPKTDSVGHYQAKSSPNSGYGYGYGLSMVTGFVVLAQREQEVSQEEYTRLSRVQYLEGTLPDLRKKVEELQTAVAADAQSLCITEKKKLIGGGFQYFVGGTQQGKKFDSRAEAESFVRGEEAVLAPRKAELEAARANLEQTEKELKTLQNG